MRNRVERPVFINTDVGRGGRPDFPLDPLQGNSTGYHLSQLCDMDESDFIDKTVRLNLFSEYTASHWPKKQARNIASMWHASGMFFNRNVVLLGKQVAAAFLPDVEFVPLRMARSGCTHYFMLPVPTYHSAWYVEDQNTAAAKVLLQDVFSDSPFMRDMLSGKDVGAYYA